MQTHGLSFLLTFVFLIALTEAVSVVSSAQTKTRVDDEAGVDQAGWPDDFAVSGDNLYWVKSRTLYRSKLDIAGGIKSVPVVGQVAWTGPFAVSDGFVYWTEKKQLYRSQLNDGGSLAPSRVGSVTWTGPFAVDGRHIYWTKDGNLYKSPVGTNQQTLVDEGGWTGPFAVSGGDVYWISGGRLYRSSLEGKIESREVAEISRNAQFGVSGPNVYWTDKGGLYRSFAGNTPSSLTQHVELRVRTLGCVKTTEAGADEVYFLIFGRRSDGADYGKRYPGNYPHGAAGHWDMNDDRSLPLNNTEGDAHARGPMTIFSQELAPGQSWSFVITIMEEDGGNTSVLQQTVADALRRFGDPFTATIGTVLEIVNILGLNIEDTDDYIGSFAVKITNTNGQITQQWRPIDRVKEHQNSAVRCCNVDPKCCNDRIHEFFFIGDGSAYHGWFQLVY